MATAEVYRDSLLARRLYVIRQFADGLTKQIDMRHADASGSVLHILDRVFYVASTVQAEVQAAVSVELVTRTITEPLSRERVMRVCKESLQRGTHKVYPLIEKVPDDSEEAIAYFDACRLVEEGALAYADQHFTEQLHEYKMAQSLALTQGIPSFILEEWESAAEAVVAGDARDVITHAKSLMETVAKHVLSEYPNIPVTSDDTLSSLLKKARFVVQGAFRPKADREAVAKIYSGLDNIVHGIEQVRNAKGNAHGRAPGDEPPDESLSRTVLMAAGAFTELLWQSHLVQSKRTARVDERTVRDI